MAKDEAKETDDAEEKDVSKEDQKTDESAEDNSSDNENNDEEGGEGKKSKTIKGKRMLLIIIIAALLVVGGGAGVYFSGILGGSHSTEEVPTNELSGHDGEKLAEKKNTDSDHGDSHSTYEPGQEIYQKMDDFLVNLSSKRSQTSFLKLTVVLVIPNETVQGKVNSIMPRIRDTLQTYLRELRPEDLQGSAGLYRLRQELLLRINKIMSPDEVDDVLFEEILVQ